MTIRRLLPLILLNAVVSLVVVLAVLYFYERRVGGVQAPLPTLSVETGVVPNAVGGVESVESAESAPILPTGGDVAVAPTPDGPVIHIVKTGETMGAISLLYDVPLGDILTANNLSDPNLVSVGQQLFIPIGGVEGAEPDVTPTPDATATPVPTATPEPIIIEIVSVDGVGDLATEQIVLANNGPGSVRLDGWTLEDESGTVYTFGQVTVFGNGVEVVLNSGPGTDGATTLFWNLSAAAWESGESATLKDPTGEVRSTFSVP
jgi:LysM repeat protein